MLALQISLEPCDKNKRLGPSLCHSDRAVNARFLGIGHQERDMQEERVKKLRFLPNRTELSRDKEQRIIHIPLIIFCC